MFCMNCGGKLVEGANFCQNCGTDITAMLGLGQKSMISSEAVSITKKNIQDIKENVATKEKVIKDVFLSVFRIKGEFGNQVFIAGRDKISHEKDIIEHFLAEKTAEELLMVFEYSKNIGFVITDQRIVWDFERGLSEIALEDIKNVEIGKSGLATVMKLTSYDNEIYPKIYLTGIFGQEEFVIKFSKFIDIIHRNLCSDLEDDKSTKKDTDFIVRSCKSVNIDSLYCEIGNPTIQSSSKRYQKARLYFNIPDQEEIFFIYDNTVLGSCKTGFALCTSGYYYCVSQKGYIPWEKFVSIDISKCFGGIAIGREVFNTSGETKQLIMILKSIQEYLR